MTFMQDNAPHNRSLATRDGFIDNTVPIFGIWPDKSEDVNPIENLGYLLEMALKSVPNPLSNICIII